MSAPFTYNENLPNPPDDPAVDVSGMQLNSQSIQGIIGVDHVTFNNNSGGYHNQVSFAINQAAPGIGLGVAELFANNVASDSKTYPYWQNASTNFPLAGPFKINANGYTTLPGGFIIQWGQCAAYSGNFSSGSTKSTDSHQSVVTLPTPFPNNFLFLGGNLYCSFSNLPSGTGTLNVRISDLSGGGPYTQFNWQVYCNTNNYTGFIWWAIGN